MSTQLRKMFSAPDTVSRMAPRRGFSVLRWAAMYTPLMAEKKYEKPT